MGVLVFSACKKKGCKNKDAINYNSNVDVVSDPSICEFLEEYASKTKIILSGSVTVPTTWSKISGATVDYYINSMISIESVLTIDPGVTIEFGPEGGLVIAKDLIVNGNSDNHVTFKNSSNISWKGIQLNIYSLNKLLHLTYLDIYNVVGEIDSYNIVMALNSYCDVQLNHVQIIGSSNIGMAVHAIDGGYSPDFMNDVVITNCKRPLVTSTEKILDYMGQITLQNNVRDWVEFDKSNYNLVSHTYPKKYPYFFSYGINPKVASLLAEPGAEFIVGDTQLHINGEVSCVGTQQDPIIFRSLDDETWKGLVVKLTYPLAFNFTSILGVANTYSPRAPLYVNSYSPNYNLTFSNGTIQGVGTNVPCGIKFSTPVSVSAYDITGTVFSGCASDVCN